MGWPEELIAAHELGHLIVAEETGHRSQGITLSTSWWSGEVTGGYCDLRSFRYPVDGSAKDWALYRSMLLVYAGGQAASAHWFQLNDQPVRFTAGSDLAFFTEDAPVMPSPPTWEQALEEARHIILPRWDDIVALTPALLEKRRMARSGV